MLKKAKKIIKNMREEKQRDRRYLRKWSADFPQKFMEKNKIPGLTEEDKSEIDRYWKNYGVKFIDYDWHAMYYHITGIKDPRFIPNNFAGVLYTYYAERELASFWTDKNYFQRFLPVLRFPEMYGQRIRGRYYDSAHNSYGEKEKSSFYSVIYEDMTKDDAKDIIVKLTSQTNTGKGVFKIHIESPSDLEKIDKNVGSTSDYIIQKVIVQHPFFAQFNEDSVNIIRITTWDDGKDIHICNPCVRFGIKGSHTDVAYVNGEEIVNCVGIEKDGHLKKSKVSLNGKIEMFDPEIESVPKWEEIVKTVKKGHEYLECFRIVGWDITLDSDENIICIEYNLKGPGTIIYQMVHGPMFGENTNEVLSFLKHKENREKYLPRSIRL